MGNMGGCAARPGNVPDEEIMGDIDGEMGVVGGSVVDPMDNLTAVEHGGGVMTYRGYQDAPVADVGAAAPSYIAGDLEQRPVSMEYGNHVAAYKEGSAPVYNPQTDGQIFESLEEAKKWAARQDARPNPGMQEQPIHWEHQANNIAEQPKVAPVPEQPESRDAEQAEPATKSEEAVASPVRSEQPPQAEHRPESAAYSSPQPAYQHPPQHAAYSMPQQPLYYNGQVNPNPAYPEVHSYQGYPEAVVHQAPLNVDPSMMVHQPTYNQPLNNYMPVAEADVRVDGVAEETEDVEAVEEEVEEANKEEAPKSKKKKRFGWF